MTFPVHWLVMTAIFMALEVAAVACGLLALVPPMVCLAFGEGLLAGYVIAVLGSGRKP